MTAVALGVFWALALAAFMAGSRALLYFFFASISFGSFAVVPPSLTGGLSLTPLPITAVLIIVRSFATHGAFTRLIRSATTPSPLGILTLFWLVAGVTTVFMPRLFAGGILVVPMRSIDRNVAPLFPSTQNFSQFMYLSLSILSVFAFSQLMRRADLRATAIRAIVVGGWVAVVTGFLDLASQFVPIDPLLAAFRTATYTLLVDAEVLGAKRVVGLMPEASSFGAICVVILSLTYFLRRAVDRGSRLRLVMPVLSVMLVLSIYLSTSSAAFLGLGVLGVLAVAEWLWRVLTLPTASGQRAVLGLEAAIMLVGMIFLIAILLFQPAVFDRLVVLVDELLLSKTDTESFVERSMWTRVAWQSAIESYGLGVGIGSARASNFWAALTSNVGYLGTLLYASFMLACYTRRAARPVWVDVLTLSACRWALLPSLALGWVVGTSADFGVLTAFVYGLMLGIGTLDRPAVHRQTTAPNLLAA